MRSAGPICDGKDVYRRFTIGWLQQGRGYVISELGAASPSDATRTGATGGPPHYAVAGELRDGMRRGPALPEDHRNR